MKIDQRLLEFPRYLPNDLEGLLFYYPVKFPPIVDEFKAAAAKIAGDPEAFRAYGDASRDDLWAAFRKIKADYDAGDQDNLEFLIEIDERFNKIYCYRFWIVNYLFPDGPIHDYIVDTLKNLIHKFVDVADNADDFEQQIVRVQRDLLQTDYADMYLEQALKGIEALKLLEQHPKIAPKLPRLTALIDKHDEKLLDEINALWQDVYEIFMADEDAAQIRKVLVLVLDQAEMRSSMLPLYNLLTQAVEFRVENERLAARYKQMNEVITAYKAQAKAKLSAEEYEMFIYCYEQARNFTVYKDVMGEIDLELLPLLFGIHQQIRKILIKRGVEIRDRPTGPTAVSAHLVWYLPDALKAKVMTADLEPFNLETI